MRHARSIPLALAAAALTAALASAAAAASHTVPGAGRSPHPYIWGYFTSTDRLPLDYLSLDAGRYRLHYSVDITAIAQGPRTTLSCSFEDPNGVIGYLQRDKQVVPTRGVRTHVAFTGPFQLPDITVALRCVPSEAGQLAVRFTDLSVTAIRLGD
jgi:hypothetical protein